MPPAEYVSIVDRSGISHLRVSIRQARELHERRLVEPVGNKRLIRAWRMTPGTCVAHINTALRTGIKDRLPMPEPYTGWESLRDGIAPVVSLKKLDRDGSIVRDEFGRVVFL